MTDQRTDRGIHNIPITIYPDIALFHYMITCIFHCKCTFYVFIAVNEWCKETAKQPTMF